MAQPSSHEMTQLLRAWNAGDKQALEHLMPLMYEELHRLAARCMAEEQEGHVLQTTALVHEVYIRLVDVDNVGWRDRAHFFALSARLMRRILIDLARSRHYQKRGGHAAHLPPWLTLILLMRGPGWQRPVYSWAASSNRRRSGSRGRRRRYERRWPWIEITWKPMLLAVGSFGRLPRTSSTGLLFAPLGKHYNDGRHMTRP